MPHTDLSWQEHDGDVPASAAHVIDQGLGEANDAAAPLHQVRPLACFVLDANGRVIGGAIGRRWGLNAELQQLWVDAPHRRHGLGAQLVRRFETIAARQGCTQVYLETFSFQAPGLYRALGYRSLATIDGFPSGATRHTMLNVLNAP